MQLKSNKSFSLLEVVITVGIMATAIVVVLRAFTTIISGVNLSQDITLACFFTEDKLWKSENGFSLEETTTEKPKFDYTYELTDADTPGLKTLKLITSWKENRNSPYSLEFYTYNLIKGGTT